MRADPTECPVPLDREFRLLADCTVRPTGKDADLWRSRLDRHVRSAIDWVRFGQLVRRHRVFALVDSALDGELRSLIPAEISRWLAVASRRARLQSLRQIGECRRIADACTVAGIDAVQLKGQPLSQRLYGDPTLRHAKDIDVLIPSTRLADAVQVMQKLGYTCQQPILPARSVTHALMLFVWHDYVFHHAATNVHVELHWRPSTWSARISDEIVPLANPDSTTGLRVLPEDWEINYLLAHGTSHYWMRLKWLSDIVQALLTRPALLGARALRIAEHTQSLPAISVATSLIGWLFADYGAVTAALNTVPVERKPAAARYALRRLGSPDIEVSGIKAFLDRTLYRMKTVPAYERWGSAIRFVHSLVPAPLLQKFQFRAGH